MRRLLLLLLIISLLSSCAQEDQYEGGNTHYTISESLMPLVFSKDSYWIYSNPESKLFDSIIVKSIRFDTIVDNIGQGSTLSHEIAKITYSSKVYGAYVECFASSLILMGDETGGCIYKSSFIPEDYFLNATITNIHDSILVNEETYFGVVEMNVLKGNFINNDMKLFFKDSVGIVRKLPSKNQSSVDNQTGLGLSLSAGKRFSMNEKLLLTIEPMLWVHSIVPFIDKGIPERMTVVGIKIGLTLR